jgi:hypothetical protein
MDDDYLSTSAFQLRRALDDINRGVYETVHDAPKRYQRGGVGEVVFGSPAWEALQVASQARVPLPVSVRIPRADGGVADLPFFAQGRDDVADALRIAQQPKVRYDVGPQPGEATLTSREVPLNEKVSSFLMGDSRPTPERRRVAESVGNLVGLLPTDPYAAAGDAVKQFTSGHPIDAFETMFGAMPETGMLKGYKRQLTPMGFYSHGAEAAANLPQAKGTYEQMMAMLRKAGVTPEEMRWAGVQEALGNKPVVTQEELAKHFHEKLPKLSEKMMMEHPIVDTFPAWMESRGYTNADVQEQYKTGGDLYRQWEANRSPAKFSQYVLPGGENYREVVLQYPGAGYQSGHWNDIDSPVAHLRMSDRTGPDGEKILHIEELQSDWAKEGQKKGFRGTDYESAFAEAKKHYDEVSKEITRKLTMGEYDDIDKVARDINYNSSLSKSKRDELIAARDAYIKNDWPQLRSAQAQFAKMRVAVPSAPYVAGGKNDWLDLALKRALREAAAGGYDKMVWTPGEAQAARYDLSKQIKSVMYDPKTKMLGARGLNGDTIIQQKISDPREIADHVGKEVADRLLKQPLEPSHFMYPGVQYLEGLDLKVGGEGMKSFYDKVVPSQLNKLLKKLDPEVKIGKHKVKESADKPVSYSTQDVRDGLAHFGEAALNRYYKSAEIPGVTGPRSQLEAAGLLDRYDEWWRNMHASPEHQLHSIDITPRMREVIMKGLPAYAAGGAVTDPVEDALRLATSHRGSKK